MPDLNLRCVFCGGKAKIVGRCATAKVICDKCRMEADPELYRNQINDWKQSVCGFKEETDRTLLKEDFSK